MFTRSSYKLIGGSNAIFPVPKAFKTKRYFSLFQSLTLKKAPDLITWCSNDIILPNLVNKKIALHNGRFFKTFQIKSSMVFNRVGNLIRTKKLGASIHVLKKKKKKK